MERRYSEEEMAEIFRRATSGGDGETGGALSTRSEGFSLAQLQEIGAEAGISPEAIRRSALELASGAPAAPSFRRYLGAPLGVGERVDLPRKLTDEEFDSLVTLLRDTFQAQGKVRMDGPYREWRNGNLVFSLEPRGEGERLRMMSRKSNGEALPTIGAALLGLAGALGVAGFLGSPGKMAELLPIIGMNVALGGTAFAVGQFRLRQWAGRRLEQMADIGRRVGIVASADPDRLPSGE